MQSALLWNLSQVICDVGITIYITAKVHNMSISSFGVCVWNVGGKKCFLHCVECRKQEMLPTLTTKLGLQYPVFENRRSQHRFNYRKDFLPAGDLENHTSGGQIAGPRDALWSIMLALPHRVPLRIRRGLF